MTKIFNNKHNSETIRSFSTTDHLNSVENNEYLNKTNTTYIQPSNLVPHFWNYKIVDKEGSPDLPCIMILAELFNWFRNLPNFKPAFHSDVTLPELIDDKLAISYDFLALKLNFQKERIRRNLVKLEQLNILKREVRNISLADGGRANQLLIVFNLDFFYSCFRDPNTDNRVIDTVNISYDTNSSNDLAADSTPLQSGDPISKKKNFKKDRSMRSNFISNYSKKEDSTLYFNNSSFFKPKTLKDFHPLCLEDCNKLQSLSGRSFSLNAMNEILQDMAERLKDKFFYSSKGFFAYMAKAFSYEMRNENLVSNETFRIKANYSEEENNIIIQEKFLTELEYSLEVSPEWHLKKKLASVLERNKAYNILSNYKKSKRVGSVYKFYISKKIELGEMDKQIILSQVKATQEKIGSSGNIEYIDKVEFIFDKNYTKHNKTIKENQSKKLANITDKEEIEKLPLLQKIRKYLMNYQNSKEEAINLDKAWFSKMEIKETQDKELKLNVKGGYIRDYIYSNYINKIEKIAKPLGYNFVSIES